MVREERVLVAMSGGVDSSVAAALLREAGCEVVGVTLHLWDASGTQKVGRCCAPEDRDDARRSCEALNIPHYVIDERDAFRAAVVDPFVDAYARGTTPSPCVACNQSVKLGRLVELADAFGCGRIATGHYARLVEQEGTLRLLRGVDAAKDQSYFLHAVGDSVLRRMIFPLGGFTKEATREEGRRLGVPNWQKRDSQELCFVPDGEIGAFVDRELAAQGRAAEPGVVRDVAGVALTQHSGVHRFTVGQRRGLGLGGGPARFVLRILPDRGVVVGDESGLQATEAHVAGVTWRQPRVARFRALVQLRYRHVAAAAWVEPTEHGFRATFDVPQRAVTPGQVSVVYEGDEVVAGGTITG